MSIILPPEFELFVAARVTSGEYASERDVLQTAFGLLEHREKLLAHIQEGTQQLRSGQYQEYGENEAAKFHSDIVAEASRRHPAG